MANTYKTRQRLLIEELLKLHKGEHLTADEIVSLLESQGKPVGKATVYRCLEKLIERGEVKKYIFGEGKSACYEYQNQSDAQYHLKCSVCGELTHLECEMLDKLPQHIFEHHGFKLDAVQTVLMGCCSKCQKAAQQ